MYWILAFGFVVCGWTMAFPNTHFLAYADDMGMSVLHAANTVSATAIFSILGQCLTRPGGRPIPAHLRTGLTYALRGAAFLLLLVLPAGNLLYVYGLVLGISWTATTPLTAAIAADRYGPKHLGLIFGSLFTFMNLGFGFGLLLGGVIFEATGALRRGTDHQCRARRDRGRHRRARPNLRARARQRRSLPLPTPEQRPVPARAVG